LQEQVNTEGRGRCQGPATCFPTYCPSEGEIPGLEDLFVLPDQIKEWTADIRKKMGLDGIDYLFGGGTTKSEQIGQEVENAVGGFDFMGLFRRRLGLLGEGADLPVPEYEVAFEKEGLRLSTGERIEAQGIALDKLGSSRLNCNWRPTG
jgi:hypothetical protein